MELLVLVALLIVGLLVGAVMLRAGLWVLFAVLLPLAWLWMLVDAILRREDEYPSRDTAEKVLWIVLMLFVQPVALAYYLLVFRKIRRGQASVTSVAEGSV